MKTVKIAGKLSLKKETIAKLNNDQLKNAFGASSGVPSRTTPPTCWPGCGTGSTCC